MYLLLREIKKFYDSWYDRVKYLNFTIIMVLLGIATISCTMLYSAAGGEFSPRFVKQVIRISVSLAVLVAMMALSVKWLFRNAYLMYFVSLAMLVVVEICGSIGMGAQRWVNLYFVTFQPSECMKIGLILALARYFSGSNTSGYVGPNESQPSLWVSLLVVAAPVVLMLRQPDLGTAMMLLITGASVVFVSGIRMQKLLLLVTVGLGSLPVLWKCLHKYQQERILTFINPDRDPLGAGYHIKQSKIAIGSGGFWGKGFLQGSQSQLNFLPEKQTDFIFSMICEEFGFIGALLVWGMYIVLILYGYSIAMRSRDYFSRYMAIGLSTTVFVYMFTNTAMTVGLIPVVGVPLPLLSYGGSAGLTLMIIIGLLMVIDIDGGIRRYHNSRTLK